MYAKPNPLFNYSRAAANRLDTIHRGFFSLVKKFEYGTMAIVFNQYCSWKVTIDGQNVFLTNDGGQMVATFVKFNDPLLNSINKVHMLLAEVDCAKLCIGNSDEKFHSPR